MSVQMRRTFEDIEMVEAQLERAVLGLPPQRGREDVIKVAHLESVVLVSFYPCDQIKPHEHVKNGVDRRRWHGNDQQSIGSHQPGNRLSPGWQLAFGHVLDDRQRGDRVE